MLEKRWKLTSSSKTKCNRPTPLLQKKQSDWASYYFLLLLLLSHFSSVQLLATPGTAAYQAPPSMGFSRQEYWSGVPLPSPLISFSVQFSRSVVSDSLQPHESQYARPLCPSSTPRVHTNSRPSSRWCHPAISSSVILFSSFPQSLPASESFPMNSSHEVAKVLEFQL